jgi:hypothetical protein
MQASPFPVKAAAQDYLAIDREGPAGMLTLILLSRPDPLSGRQLVDIMNTLQSLKGQAEPAPTESTIQRFSFRNGRPSPRTSNENRHPLTDQHPVKLMLMDLMKQFGSDFDQIEVVTFAVPEYSDPRPSSDSSKAAPAQP